MSENNVLTRSAWLEVDLDQLVQNYRNIQKHVGKNANLMAVVKADAYGHGSRHIVETLKENGVRSFAVATLSEARYIKKHAPDVSILILGVTPDYLLETAIEEGFKLTVSTREQGLLIAQIAQKKQCQAVIHIKLETGMGRLGFSPDAETEDALLALCRLPNLTLEGIFTHFADSEVNFPYTRQQALRFTRFIQKLESLGIRIPIRHVCNSAAIIQFPEYNFDMVRAGIILYGIDPTPSGNPVGLKHIGALKAQVSHVRILNPGDYVGYGLTFQAKQKTRMAIVPIGYADGYSRHLSNHGHGLIHGKRVPIIGRIAMDQMVLDVTGLPVAIGDEVVLLGRQGNQEITIWELAEKTGEICASVMVSLSKRLPRVYIKDGKIYQVLDYLLT